LNVSVLGSEVVVVVVAVLRLLLFFFFKIIHSTRANKS